LYLSAIAPYMPSRVVDHDGDITIESFVVRLENRTGKSRPDRHRRPSKPTVNRLIRKTGKTGKKPGKPAGAGAESVWGSSRPYCRFLFSPGKIPAGNPVFVGHYTTIQPTYTFSAQSNYSDSLTAHPPASMTQPPTPQAPKPPPIPNPSRRAAPHSSIAISPVLSLSATEYPCPAVPSPCTRPLRLQLGRAPSRRSLAE
jgi:hypothetical protein